MKFDLLISDENETLLALERVSFIACIAGALAFPRKKYSSLMFTIKISENEA